MRYKALVSFSGKISMAKGQVKEISDSALVDDLAKAGYIISFEAEVNKKNDTEVLEKKTVSPKPKPKRKGKANEN